MVHGKHSTKRTFPLSSKHREFRLIVKTKRAKKSVRLICEKIKNRSDENTARHRSIDHPGELPVVDATEFRNCFAVKEINLLTVRYLFFILHTFDYSASGVGL